MNNLANKQWRVLEAAQDGMKFCVVRMTPNDVNGMVYLFAREQALAVEVANLLNDRDGYKKIKVFNP